MSDLHITVPESMSVPKDELAAFYLFLQRMTNRRCVGSLRYGRIQARQRFMSRMEKEIEAYRRTGNAEQLLNIAVYAFLEFEAPENRKYHFDAAADSVTRQIFGGSNAQL